MRFAGLSLAVPGELATTLAGMGRPVPMHELERWPELRGELAPFLGAGVALLAPLRGPDGLEGVLVSDERLDGVSWTGEDRLAVGALCDLAATAHLNARRYLEAQDRALELTAARAHVHPNAAKAAAESSRLAERVAQSLELPARERGLLRHAVAFGPWGWGGEGSAKLRAFVQGDSSRRAEMLCSLIERGESLELEAARTVAERQAALIAGVCARHQVGRVSGRSPMESWNTAVAWAGSAMDPALNEAFALALRDVVSPREIHRAA
jgi:GAF domain-containing protein